MPRLKIGEWLVDPATNQISRGPEVQHLEPKATDVLMFLARAAGRVVSRDDLLSEIWKGVIVSDDALTQSITKLRQALGDTATAPSYIQTIPKRGYRLIAAVTTQDDGVAPRSDTLPRRVVPRRLPAAVWAIGPSIVAAAVAAYWYFGHSGSPHIPTIAELRAPGASLANLGDFPAVIVQPFNEVEGDQLQALLARGFTARLVTDLSRLPDIRVFSTRSPAESREAGSNERWATAGYVVTGELQRSGEHIRLYVRVAEAASGRSLWSEQFDRSYSDLLALQDELVPQVLGAMRVKVTQAELLRRARPYTRNVEAYENFLRAQSALIIRRKSENETARQFYTKAIQADPTFARAYAGLALTHVADWRNRWTSDGAAALAKAFDLAEKARQLDPELPEVYFVLAYVANARGALSQAVDELRTALRINPSYADAYALLGAIHTYQGQPNETIPLIRTAMRLVPDSGHLYYLILGRAYFFLHDATSALAYLRQASALNPESVEIRLFLAAALVLAGRRDEAAWEAEEVRTLEPAFNVREWLKSYPMSDARQVEQLTQAVSTVGL